MLISLQAVDTSGRYAYAPPTRPIAVNVSAIVSITPIACRRLGRHSRVRLTDGAYYDCVGAPADIVAQAGAVLAQAAQVPAGVGHE